MSNITLRDSSDTVLCCEQHPGVIEQDVQHAVATDIKAIMAQLKAKGLIADPFRKYELYIKKDVVHFRSINGAWSAPVNLQDRDMTVMAASAVTAIQKANAIWQGHSHDEESDSQVPLATAVPVPPTPVDNSPLASRPVSPQAVAQQVSSTVLPLLIPGIHALEEGEKRIARGNEILLNQNRLPRSVYEQAHALIKLHDEVQDLLNKLANTPKTAEVADLQRRLQDLQQNLLQQRSQFLDLLQPNALATPVEAEEVQRLRARVLQLNDELAQAIENNRTSQEAATALVTEYTQELLARDDELQKLKDALETAQIESDAAFAAASAMRTNNDATVAALADRTREIEELEQRATDTQAHFENLQQKYKARIQELAKKSDDALEQLRITRNALADARARVNELENECERLQSQLNQAHSTLSEANNDAEERLKAVQKQLHDAQTQAHAREADFHKQLAALNATNETQAAAIEKLFTRANASAERVQELTALQEELQNQIADYEQANAQLGFDYALLEKRCADADTAYMAALTERDETLSTLRQELLESQILSDGLQQEVATAHTHIQNLTSELEQARLAHQEIEKRRGQTQAELDALRTTSSAQIASLTKELNQAQEEAAAAQQALHAGRRDVKARLAEGLQTQNEAIAAAETRVEESRRELEDLRSKQASHDAELQQLRARAEKADTDLSSAQQAHIAREKELTDRITTLQEDNAQLAQNLEAITTARQNAATRITELERERDALAERMQTQQAQIDDQAAQINAGHLAREDFQRTIATMQATIAASDSTAEEQERAKAELEKALESERNLSTHQQSQLAKLQASLEVLDTEHTGMTSRAAAQQSSLDEALAANRDKEQRLGVLQAELENQKNDLNDQINALKGQLAVKNTEYSNTEEARLRAEARIVELEAQLVTNSSELEQIRKERDSLRQENAKLQAEISRLKVLLEKAKEDFATETTALRRDIDLAQKALVDSDNRCRQLTVDLDNRVQEITQLRNEIDLMGRTNRASQQQLEALRVETAALRAQNAKLAAGRVADFSRAVPVADLELDVAGMGNLDELDPMAIVAQIPEHICFGHIESVIDHLETTETIKRLIPKALSGLLRIERPDPKQVDMVYNLAIYLANWAGPQAVKDLLIFRDLRNWLIQRQLHVGECNAIEQQKRLTLLLALGQTTNECCGSLVTPMQQMLPLNLAAREGHGPRSFEWAHRLLTSDPNTLSPEERQIRWHLEAQLKKAEENAREKPLALDGHTISLIELLACGANPLGETLHLGGAAHSVKKAYEENKELRLKLIKEAIAAAIANATHAILDRATGEAAALPDVRLEGTCPRENDRSSLQHIEQAFAATKAGQPLDEAGRVKILTWTRDRLHHYLSKLTGLGCSAETTVPKLLAYVQQHGRLPSAVGKALFRQGAENARAVAELLYYYNALNHPASRGFGDLASLRDWNWLLQGLSEEEAANRIFLLLQALHQDTNFPKGQPLSRQQVGWAESIYRLLLGGKPEPIYADAGTGKTATAQFIIRFLKQYMPDCRDKCVHVYSPFLTPPIPGMESHQLIHNTPVHIIEVPTPADFDKHVVLVDEGHLLEPDVQFVLRARTTGETRSIEPLQMTATPVVPHTTFARYRAEELTHLFTQMRTVVSGNQRAKEAAILAEQRRLVEGDIRANAPRMGAKLGHYKIPMPIPKLIDPRRTSGFLRFVPHGIREKAYPEAANQLASALSNPIAGAELIRAIEEFRRQLRIVLDTKATTPHTPISGQDRINAEAFLVELAGLREQAEALADPSRTRLTSTLLQRLLAERDALERSYGSMGAKMARWADKARRAEEQEAIHIETREQRVQRIIGMDYATAPLQHFSPTSASDAAAAIAGRLRSTRASRMQVLMPGVRFTDETFMPFVDGLAKGLNDIGYPLRFVYHDSHSKDGAASRSYVLTYSGPGTPAIKIPLEELLRSGEATVTTIMLYDMTNIQGGDFGQISRASSEHDIPQWIFYNYTSTEGRDPAHYASQNDIYQAMRRRRGESGLAPHVYGSYPKGADLATNAQRRQAGLEKGWAIRNVASSIAAKRIKARVINHDPSQATPGRGSRDQSMWKARKAQLLAQHGHEREVLAVTTALHHPSAAMDFMATWEKEAAAFALPVVTGRMSTPGSEYIWQAFKAFHGADHLLRWAQSYDTPAAVSGRATGVGSPARAPTTPAPGRRIIIRDPNAPTASPTSNAPIPSLSSHGPRVLVPTGISLADRIAMEHDGKRNSGSPAASQKVSGEID